MSTARARCPLVVWACAVTAVALVSAAMAAHGFGFGQQLRLAAATTVQILLPGIGLTGWMRRPSLPAQLGAAYVLGLPFQLIGWAVGVTTGQIWLMWAVPAAIGALLVSLQRRRLLTNFSARNRVSGWASVGLLGLWAVLVGKVAAHWTTQTLSDKGSFWYKDLYWHLSLNASAMRGLPLRDPQAAGEFFSYHWFTNAHIGGLARSTGIDIVGLSVHAWVFAALAALVGLTFGFARYFVRSSTVGVLAVALLVMAPAFTVNSAVRASGFSNFQILSPSHMLAMPVTMLVAWLFSVALGAGRTRRRAVALPIVVSVLLVAGVKVSTLPVLTCGVIAAVLPLLLIRRRFFVWMGLIAGVGTTLLATFPLFGGGGGGSSFGILSSQAKHTVWVNTEPLLQGHGPRGDLALWLAFVGLLALNAIFTLPGVLGLRLRQPTGWLLLGMICSAFGVTLVLSHPGHSEAYFPMAVQPLVAVTVAAGVVALVRNTSNVSWLDMFATAVCGLVIGSWLVTSEPWDSLTLSRVGFGVSVATVLAAVAGIAINVLGVRRALAFSCIWLVAAASSHGFLLTLRGENYEHLHPQVVSRHRAASKSNASAITSEEMAALEYMTVNLPIDAVVATNVHCLGAAPANRCDARAFWVAGVGQRQVLLGGWGYTTLGRSTQGEGGRSHILNPYPDRQLYELNERAFQRPDDATFEALKAKGVTHLFADRRASAVEDIAPWCDTIFENATVTVCALR